MLTHLAIRNLALIEQADLAFAPGFTVLTGETGAGKSLLLDALGLALGERADFALMRPGCLTTDVTATFELPKLPPALADIIDAQGLAADEGQLMLRRQLKAGEAGGKKEISSKGWVNGTPVPATVLAQLAEHLLDVHSQHATQQLFSAVHQRELCDELAGLQAERRAVAEAFVQWQKLARSHADAERLLTEKSARAETEAVWRGELTELAYQPGEEETLAEQRQRAGQAQQIAGSLSATDEALNNAALPALRAAGKALQQAVKAEPLLDPLCEQLFGLLSQAEDVSHSLAQQTRDLGGSELDVEKIDDRLHALRAAARKHRVDVPGLADVLAGLTAAEEDLQALAKQKDALARALAQAEAALQGACKALSTGRQAQAPALEAKLTLALRALHLPHAMLAIRITPLTTPTAAGSESIELLFTANPGLPAQALGKVASGGELSRAMLALKTVLFEALPAQTIVLDEVDSGLSGPTAAAVGRAMAKLAGQHQVLAVTHHPQVAAAAAAHLNITKQHRGGANTNTEVFFLAGEQRTEELARLLAGEKISAEARAAARVLQSEMAAHAA